MKIFDTLFGTIMNLIIAFSSYHLTDRLLHAFDASDAVLYGTIPAVSHVPTGGVVIPTGWNTHPLLSTAGFVFIIVFGILSKWDAHAAEAREAAQGPVAFDLGDIMKGLLETPIPEEPEKEDTDVQ